MMKIIKGRDNLSVTVHIPVDCTNNCKFCTSKKLYKKNGTDIEEVKDKLRAVSLSNIKEVVFTGGEPTENIELLKELVSIVNNKDVYINTSLPEKNAYEFIEYVNDSHWIRGVNISRHKASLEEDEKILSNIAEDVYIKFIRKPVKINVVTEDGDLTNKEFILSILDRWKKVDNGRGRISVCFRADYRKMDIKTLFALEPIDDPNIFQLMKVGEYIGRSYCSVCHTMRFNYEGLDYSYHKGIELTSRQIGNTLEVNDIIIFPNGVMGYDWDGTCKFINDVNRAFQINLINESKAIPKPAQKKIAYERPYIGCSGIASSSSCGISAPRTSSTTTLSACGVTTCGGTLYNRSCF